MKRRTLLILASLTPSTPAQTVPVNDYSQTDCIPTATRRCPPTRFQRPFLKGVPMLILGMAFLLLFLFALCFAFLAFCEKAIAHKEAR